MIIMDFKYINTHLSKKEEKTLFLHFVMTVINDCDSYGEREGTWRLPGAQNYTQE